MINSRYMLIVGILSVFVSAVVIAAEPETVKLRTTISGNQEQPKTIYILPWQTPVSIIRIPAQQLPEHDKSVSPLDRQQFLRFIAVQSATVSLQTKPDSN